MEWLNVMSLNIGRIVAATDNKHKIKEIEAIVSKFGIEVITKAEAGAGSLDVEENGVTFEENSLIKAEAVMKATGMPSIADDSGLEVDALDGAPGVYSARFAGDHGDDDANNEKLMELMKDVPDDKRGARFVSVVTLCMPDGGRLVARGECPGRIGYELKGTNGFGYDPLFLPDGYDVTYAQITDEQKNEISHRARALRVLEKMISE